MKVGVVVVNIEGQVLLIKEKLEKKPVALWNIIKGSYDPGESLEEAATRECLEEAGVSVQLQHMLPTYVTQSGDKLRVQFNFVARTEQDAPVLAGQNEQKLRNESIEEARWFPVEEVLDLDPNEFVSSNVRNILDDWKRGNVFPLTVHRWVNQREH